MVPAYPVPHRHYFKYQLHVTLLFYTDAFGLDLAVPGYVLK